MPEHLTEEQAQELIGHIGWIDTTDGRSLVGYWNRAACFQHIMPNGTVGEVVPHYRVRVFDQAYG